VCEANLGLECYKTYPGVRFMILESGLTGALGNFASGINLKLRKSGREERPQSGKRDRRESNQQSCLKAGGR